MPQHTQPELPLREHLEELRRRLFIAAVAVAIGTGVGFAFHQRVLRFLTAPARQQATLVFTDLTEMLGVSMKVSLMGGLLLALPVVVYQAVRFMAPGLTPRERRYLVVLLPGVSLAFAAGVTFGYFVLIPPAIRFLLTFNADLATPFVRIGNYINLILNLMFWMGVSFELPVIMWLLARTGVVRARTFARGRRLAIVVAFVLGAIITPTFDPVNQALVALPMLLLYELGVWLAWLARREKKKRGARPQEPEG
ncbi:MAG: twin-arginine translocase subunit TatC [Chloroflexi bacterium]|nr:twin-arginine translocase subunit TatC [Chloroflexota bacterium]